MGSIVHQITRLAIVYSAVYSGADQRKHQSSASLAFVRGIHRGPVNSPHKWPVTRVMVPFDDVIMNIKTKLYVPPVPLCNLCSVISAKLGCLESDALEPPTVLGLMESEIACKTQLIHRKLLLNGI